MDSVFFQSRAQCPEEGGTVWCSMALGSLGENLNHPLGSLSVFSAPVFSKGRAEGGKGGTGLGIGWVVGWGWGGVGGWVGMGMGIDWG